jgi:beta-1,4-N-acetylglucosaminyltransferase
MKKEGNENKKLLLVSSSGGHFEQLKMLKVLGEKYEICVVTEKTSFVEKADYYMIPTGSDDWLVIFKSILNMYKSLLIWLKEKPDYVISTGTMVVLPFALMAKIMKKRIIYIETFAKMHDKTRTGAIMYKIADLFIIQWESLREHYPNAVYGGSIY